MAECVKIASIFCVEQGKAPSFFWEKKCSPLLESAVLHNGKHPPSGVAEKSRDPNIQ